MNTSIYASLNLEKKPNSDWSKPVLCPFHNDRRPSMGVNMRTWRFHCHACGASGSIYDYYMSQTGASFHEAKKNIDEEETYQRVDWQKIREEEKRLAAEKAAKEAFQEWQRNYADILKCQLDLYELAMKISPKLLELFAHDVPVWKYHLSILIEGKNKTVRELYADRNAWDKPFNQEVFQWLKQRKAYKSIEELKKYLKSKGVWNEARYREKGGRS